MSKIEHVAWPKVKNFHTLRKDRKEQDRVSSIEYALKTKLHGTNAGVQRKDGILYAQSRSRVLSKENDNMGFASFVEENAELFEQLRDNSVLFGEWCGPGIQNGMASCKTESKFFAVFGLVTEKGMLISKPDKLREIFDESERFKIIDFVGGKVTMRFDGDENEDTLDYLNRLVLVFEQCDPFMQARFGIEGMGEGVVAFPRLGDTMRLEDFGGEAFKAKGLLHRSVKSAKAAQNDPEKVKGMEYLADLCVTEARIEQGLGECGGEYDMRRIKDFICWVCDDCIVECSGEIELSGLTEKQARKAIGKKAASVFKKGAGL